jgi:SAM-dependent methyltransferase
MKNVVISFKKSVRWMLFNKFIAKLAIKTILRSHNLCYRLAGQYASILNGNTHPKHYILKYKEWFLENIEPGWNVLDIGSNTGLLPCILAEKAGFVYGIEIKDEYVAIARMQNARNNITYICADVTSYDYNLLNDINCVTISNTLEHIENRVECLKRIVSKINWAEKKSKTLLFRIPQFDREWLVVYKKEMGIEYSLDPSHYIEYTLEQFKDELKQANITVKKVDIRFGEIYAVCQVVDT